MPEASAVVNKAVGQHKFQLVMRSNDKICFQNAGSYPYKGGKEACPAKGKQCRACNGYNHFAKCCKSKKNKNTGKYGTDKNKTICAVNVSNYKYTNNNASDDDEIRYIFAVNDSKEQLPIVEVYIENNSMKMLINPGASVNLLDMVAYNTLGLPGKLKQTQMKLYSYGSNVLINLVGSFTANIKYRGGRIAAELHVIANIGGCLLLYSTVICLGII